MPAIEYTAEEQARDIAMMARSRDVYMKLRPMSAPVARPVMRELIEKRVVVETPVKVCGPAIPIPPVPNQRHWLDAQAYNYPLRFPVYAPEGPAAFGGPNWPILRIKDVVADVARIAGVRPEDVRGPSRLNKHVRPRQFAIWTIYNSNYVRHMGLLDLGQQFGGRDHTTILASVRRIEKHIAFGALDPLNPGAWFRSPPPTCRRATPRQEDPET